ncbi:carboxypeptidase regulatory-like domain-containing protein, partial [bacterium]
MKKISIPNRFYNLKALSILLPTLLLSLNLGTQTAQAAAPANDNFSKAQAISGISGATTGDVAQATVEANEPGVFGEKKTVWYKWTAPYRGYLHFTTLDSPTDGVVRFYKGTSIGALDFVGTVRRVTNTNDWETFLAVKQSEVIYVRVNRETTTKTPSTAYKLSWDLTVAPQNDDFAQAAVISGSSGSILGSNVEATIETNEAHALTLTSSSATVWYKWKSPFTGKATFDFTGSTFTPRYVIYAQSTALTPVKQSWDGSKDVLIVTPNVVANTTYYIQVWGIYPFIDKTKTQGTFALSWSTGGTATRSISGQVYNGSQLPIMGAVVRAGTQSFTTGFDGFYFFSGLPLGSYNVTATVPITGYIAQPQGFTNPVQLGGNAKNINFKAVPAPTPTPT